MRIEGVPLNAGPLGHHAEGGERRPDAAVQLDRGLDDPPPGVGLPLGAALQGVGPGHVNFTAQLCASILTAVDISMHSMCTFKCDGCPPRPVRPVATTR